MSIRVLITDDHALVREGLKSILAATPDMVGGEAENGFQALEKIRTELWDVVLLDISMPGMNGIEVLKLIKREYPLLPVLMLSMNSREQYEPVALRAGAAAYLTKDSASLAIVSAIRQAIGPLGSPSV